MNQDREEKKIKELFDELKRQDERRVPSFARLWAAAVARSESVPHRNVRLRFAVAFAALALIVVVLANFLKQPTTPSASTKRAELAASISQWQSPTDFLLVPVDRQLLKTLPRLGDPLHGVQGISSYKTNRRIL